MKRLLCIWLPDWPIQRLRAEQLAAANPCDSAALDASPPTGVVLWKQDARQSRCVVARDAHAAALGVRVGMPLSEASELVQRSRIAPRVEPHDPQLDHEALSRIALRLLEEISPLVAIEALDPTPWAGHPLHQPQSIISEITGIAHLFGDEAGLLAACEGLLASMGLEARLGIADTLTAAWAVTHYGAPRTIVPVHGARQALADLPVQSLRLMPDTVATLSRLGVDTVDALLRLPRDGLATRLGDKLIRRIAEALGEADEPLAVFRPPTKWDATHELEYPTDDRAILADRIGTLVDQVKVGLADRGRGALRLICRLDLSDRPPSVLEVGLFSPTQDAEHLRGLLIGALERKPLPSTVTRITVDVTHSSPIRSSQTSLFGDSANEWTQRQSTARLIESLSGRLGRDAVLGVALEKDPLPEKAYRTWMMTGTLRSPSDGQRPNRSRRSQEAAIAPPEIARHQRRPIALLSQPVPLGVEPSFGSEPYRPPTKFRHAGRLHTVLRFWGPERIETGWWYGPCIRRDYYRVETESGACWIFRDLTVLRDLTGNCERTPASQHRNSAAVSRNSWMLHGWFA